MSDIMDFTLIGGWHLEAEADEENKVLHMTVSNIKGNVKKRVINAGGEVRDSLTFSIALIEEDKNEKV
jgi:hypothetical protein